MAVEKEKSRCAPPIRNRLQRQNQRAGVPAPHLNGRKSLRWLALGVLVTNGHCGCTKVTNIIFEHHPYQRGQTEFLHA